MSRRRRHARAELVGALDWLFLATVRCRPARAHYAEQYLDPEAGCWGPFDDEQELRDAWLGGGREVAREVMDIRAHVAHWRFERGCTWDEASARATELRA